MAPSPAPNTVRVNIRSTLDGEQLENTLHFFNALVSWDADLLLQLAMGVANAWQASALPLQTSLLTFREVEATYLGAAFGPQAVHTVNEAGGNGSPALPNNVSFCVSFRTGLIGRSYRGRNYFAGLTEGQVLGNDIAPATADAIVNAYAQVFLEAAVVGPGTQPVVLSRYANGEQRPVATVAVITNINYTDLVVDSQRRRLPGRGT